MEESVANNDDTKVRFHKRSWDQSYQLLTEFANEHGHTIVPKELVILQRWTKQQRYEYGKIQRGKLSALKEDQIAKLNSICFVWNAQDCAWENQYSQLRQYYYKKGHCNISYKDTHLAQLRRWLYVQKQLINNSTTTEKDRQKIERLAAIGVVLHSRRTQWEALLSNILEYKAQHQQSACIPVWFRTKHNVPLGRQFSYLKQQWKRHCSNISNHLTLVKVQQLEQIAIEYLVTETEGALSIPIVSHNTEQQDDSSEGHRDNIIVHGDVGNISTDNEEHLMDQWIELADDRLKVGVVNISPGDRIEYCEKGTSLEIENLRNSTVKEVRQPISGNSIVLQNGEILNHQMDSFHKLNRKEEEPDLWCGFVMEGCDVVLHPGMLSEVQQISTVKMQYATKNEIDTSTKTSLHEDDCEENKKLAATSLNEDSEDEEVEVVGNQYVHNPLSSKGPSGRSVYIKKGKYCDTMTKNITIYSELNEEDDVLNCVLTYLKKQHMMTSNERVVTIGTDILTCYDLCSVKPGKYLNDAVIQCFLRLVDEKRCSDHGQQSEGMLKKNAVFNTHFCVKLNPEHFTSTGKYAFDDVYRYAPIHRTRVEANPFLYEKIIIPINFARAHWGLIVVNMTSKTLATVDSLREKSEIGPYRKKYHQKCERILNWLNDWKKHGKEQIEKRHNYNRAEWAVNEEDCPQQSDGYNCGVFMCMFIHNLICGRNVGDWEHREADKYRNLIGTSVLRGKLMMY